jgi:hypothetical protein
MLGGTQSAAAHHHRFPIAQAARAYNLITAKSSQPFLGVLITYDARPTSRSMKVEFQVHRAASSAVRLGVLGAGKFADATLLPAIKRVGRIDLVGIASGGLQPASGPEVRLLLCGILQRPGPEGPPHQHHCGAHSPRPHTAGLMPKQVIRFCGKSRWP